MIFAMDYSPFTKTKMRFPILVFIGASYISILVFITILVFIQQSLGFRRSPGCWNTYSICICFACIGICCIAILLFILISLFIPRTLGFCGASGDLDGFFMLVFSHASFREWPVDVTSPDTPPAPCD